MRNFTYSDHEVAHRVFDRIKPSSSLHPVGMGMTSTLRILRGGRLSRVGFILDCWWRGRRWQAPLQNLSQKRLLNFYLSLSLNEVQSRSTKLILRKYWFQFVDLCRFRAVYGNPTPSRSFGTYCAYEGSFHSIKKCCQVAKEETLPMTDTPLNMSPEVEYEMQTSSNRQLPNSQIVLDILFIKIKKMC